MIGAVASITRPDMFTKIVMLSGSPRYRIGTFSSFNLQKMRKILGGWLRGSVPRFDFVDVGAELIDIQAGRLVIL